MDLHPDFNDLLVEFVRSGVRFVLLGGYAVGIHAKPRATQDLRSGCRREGPHRLIVWVEYTPLTDRLA
jgi:hypothetical protein